MATYTSTKSIGVKTLTAATVDTCTLSFGYRFIEVTNWDSTDRISFRLDGTAPAVDANDNYIVGPGQSLMVPSFSEPDVIKLISAGTAKYSISGTN